MNLQWLNASTGLSGWKASKIREAQDAEKLRLYKEDRMRKSQEEEKEAAAQAAQVLPPPLHLLCLSILLLLLSHQCNKHKNDGKNDENKTHCSEFVTFPITLVRFSLLIISKTYPTMK
jgi:hypothetical protein